MRVPHLGAFGLLLVLGGCGLVRLGKHSPPPGRLIVVDVLLEGDDLTVSPNDVLEGLFTWADNFGSFENKPLLGDRELLKDYKRLAHAYQRMGRFQARVLSHRVEPIDDISVRVTFTVYEGPATRVREVLVTGLQPVGDAQADQRLMAAEARARPVVTVGDIWTEAAHRQTKERLVTELRRRGFLYAEVVATVVVSEDRASATARYDVVPGPLCRVGSVAVTGNKIISTPRILRRVDLKPGDVYDSDLMSDTERHVYGLGMFLSASVRPLRTPLDTKLRGRLPTLKILQGLQWNAQPKLLVTVQERTVHEIRVGTGVEFGSDANEFYLLAGYQNRNLFGGLRLFDFQARPKYVTIPTVADPQTHGPAIQTDLLFKQPALFEEYLSLTLVGSWAVTLEQEAQRHEVRGTLAFSRPFFAERLTLTVGYTTQFEAAFGIADDALQLFATGDLLQEQTVLSYLHQTATLDLRDAILDTRNGGWFQLEIHQSAGFLGSDAGYVRLTTDLRGYWTPVRWLTLTGRALWAQNFPFDSKSLPEVARIQGGGANDNRGFGASKMGPAICGDSELTASSFATCQDGSAPVAVIGGSVKLLLSGEARLYLPWNFGLVAFVDAGQLWDTAAEVSGDTFELTVGPGVRYFTPIGAIRFDFGLRPLASEGFQWELHFNVGQAF